MQGLPLIGYTAVTVAFLAALGSLVRVTTHQSAGGIAEALPFLLANGISWPLGAWVERAGGHVALGRSLRLLAEALLPSSLLWAALLLGVGPTGLALALAAGVHLALTVRHALTDRGRDGLYAWFSAGWGALLLWLARHAAGLDPATILWIAVGYGLFLHVLSTRLSWPDDARFAQAGNAVVAVVILATGAVHGRAPSLHLLAALYAASALLAGLAFWNERLGAGAKWAGLSAYATMTATLSITLAYLDAHLYVYVAATAGWIAVLAAVGAGLTSLRFASFRESAHWMAIGLALWLAIATTALWWTAAGLPAMRWRVIGSPAEWRVMPIAPVSTAALFVVAIAVGLLAYWRRRHPPIALSLAGLVTNRVVTVGASFLAPTLLVLGACAAWVAAGADAAWAPLAPLVVGAVLLNWPGAERGFGSAGWFAGGYLALVTSAALTWQAGHDAVAFLLAGTAVVLARAIWTRTRAVLALIAVSLTAAGVRLYLGGPDTVGLALLAVGALAGARLLEAREGATLRLWILSGWAVLAAIVALVLALVRAPHALLAPLVLWAGLPIVLAARRRGKDQKDYEPGVFVGEWLATATYLLVHAAGAAAVVLAWRALGFAIADAGPILAAWAWAHLAVFKALRERAPGQPATIATAVASQALAIVSLALPLFSTSRRVAVATLLIDAALFFSWSDPRRPTGWSRGLATLGHALVAGGLVLAAFGGAEAASQALLGAAFVYWWRARQTGSNGAHWAFLASAAAGALVAMAAHPEPPRLLPLALMAMALVAIGALGERVEGRQDPARVTWMWALVLGFAAVTAAVWRGAAGLERLAPVLVVPLWIVFRFAAGLWETGTPEDAARPCEPEDVWLGLGTHWLAHLAGGASVVAVLLAAGRGVGVAAAALAGWAWIHWLLSSRTTADDPMGRRALRHAVFGLAAGALVVAAFAASQPQAGIVACALAGGLFLRLQVEDRSPWLALAPAAAFVEASWLLGSRMQVDVVEYYLTAAALGLYLALRLRDDGRVAAAGPEWMLGGPGAWMRAARHALLPAAIGVMLVGYPFWALLREQANVHLFYLGGATALLLFGFWFARQNAFYTYASCLLFMGGAIVLLATRRLDGAGTWFLLASVPLVLLTVLFAGGRKPRGTARAVASPSGADRVVA